MLRVVSLTVPTPRPSEKEVLRYMRAGKTCGENIEKLADEGIRRVCEAACCKVCYARLELNLLDEGNLMLGDILLRSKSLYKWLEGCREAFLFAASVGQSVDRVIRAAGASSPSLSLACDAAGSALVEEVCDVLNSKLDSIIRLEGGVTVKRFSAGYGDLDLTYQKNFSEALNTAKNIGACLTGGVMMSPTKTVTAIIGIKFD